MSGRALAFAAIAWLATPVEASTSLLHCVALDAATLDKGGTIAHGRAAEGDRILWADFIVDLATGMVRRGSDATRFLVVQVGDSANDTVMVLPDVGGLASLRNASTDFLRVRQWDGIDPPVFIAFALSGIVTGTCTEIASF